MSATQQDVKRVQKQCAVQSVMFAELKRQIAQAIKSAQDKNRVQA